MLVAAFAVVPVVAVLVATLLPAPLAGHLRFGRAGACVDAEVAGAVACFEIGVVADAAAVVDFATAGFDARDLGVEGIAVEADAVSAAGGFAAAHHVRRVVAAVVAGDLADLSADMAVVIDVVQRNAGGVFGKATGAGKERDAVAAGDEADVVELRGVAVFVERALELLRAGGDASADAAAVLYAGDGGFQRFAVHVAFVGVFR